MNFQEPSADKIRPNRFPCIPAKGVGTFVSPGAVNTLLRENKNGRIIACNGFTIEVFSDESENVEIDVFSAAVDFELVKNSLAEVEQFAKDYIDCKEKEYQRMLDEFKINK